MKKALRISIASAAMGVLGIASQSHASLLAYEPFGENPGTFSSTSADSGNVGLANTWTFESTGGAASIASGSLSSPYVSATSGNSAVLSGTSSGYIIANQFNGTGTQNPLGLPTDNSHGTLWVGALVEVTTPVLSGAFGQIRIDNNDTETDLVNVGFNGTDGSNWGFSENGFVSTNATITQNSVALLVLELNYNGAGNDTAELFLNPTSSSSTPIASATGKTLGTDAVDMIELTAIGDSTNNTTMNYDEIRIGTTFADVVPEPAPVALLGAVGAMGLLRRRRI